MAPTKGEREGGKKAPKGRGRREKSTQRWREEEKGHHKGEGGVKKGIKREREW